MPWYGRLRVSTWTWTACAFVILAGASLWTLMADVMRSRTADDGTVIPGLNSDALWLSASKAAPTMIFWLVCFILVDRYKPQRLLVWVIALGWGACVAVTGAYYINSWVGAQMAVVDDTSGVSAIRVAVFVAPFVEEAMKASIIFLIVVLDRNRFSSRVSGAVVGGLAGAGFAFTENIIYYARAIVYGSYTSGTGDVMAYLNHMVYMRGVLTCFGHPLFTLMTGVGVAFGVTSRSKIVRVVAPVSGYLLAALLHMFFNWQSSIISEDQLIPLLVIIAWPIVAIVAVRVAISSVRQGRTVAHRLGDYVTMGWLPASYPAALSTLRRRAWTLVMSLWHGHPVRTWVLQTRATELALLREAVTRGTVDAGGLWREHQLINEIASLARRGAVVDGRGLRPYWPWNARRRRSLSTRIPSHGMIDKPPMALGSKLKYSASDPRWGPPT